MAGEDTIPSQDFTFPLSKKFYFQPLKESTIEFEIRAVHDQENIQQTFTTTALDDIQIDADITRSGAIKV